MPGVPVGGGEPQTVTTAGEVTDLAVAGDEVFWVEPGAQETLVRKAPLAGGPAQTLAAVEGRQFPASLTVYDGQVYWANSRAGTIMRVAR